MKQITSIALVSALALSFAATGSAQQNKHAELKAAFEACRTAPDANKRACVEAWVEARKAAAQNARGQRQNDKAARGQENCPETAGQKANNREDFRAAMKKCIAAPADQREACVKGVQEAAKAQRDAAKDARSKKREEEKAAREEKRKLR